MENIANNLAERYNVKPPSTIVVGEDVKEDFRSKCGWLSRISSTAAATQQSMPTSSSSDLLLMYIRVGMKCT